ncbi:MAG: PepSY domain-containing protein [Geovibrio sp.]|jgi:hypothetical protein|nr:PepSY domain-containing protein [Geovibrio sp.]
MKKAVLLTLAVVLAAGMAFAYGPGAKGGRGGFGGCGGAGYQSPCGGGPCGSAAADFQPVTEEAAKAAVEKYVAENFKGFKIDKFDKFVMPRGESYQATVKDANGNTFYFHVRMDGSVFGPITAN